MNGTKIYYSLCGLAGVLLVFQWKSGLILLVILLFPLYSSSFDRHFRLIGLSIFLLFAMRSLMTSINEHSHYKSGVFAGEIQFIEKPNIDGDQMTAIVKTSLHEKILLAYHIPSQKELSFLKKTIRPHIICEIKGKLEAPIAPTNKNAFDYKRYLLHQGIHWRLKVNQSSYTNCSKKSNSYDLKLSEWRERSLQKIKQSYHSNSAPLISALLFGDRSMIDDQLITVYQQLGIIHLLSISGLHVSAIFSMIYFLLNRLGVTRERSAIIVVSLLPCYILLTGASPPVVRASVTLMGFFILYIMKKRWMNLDLLSVVFLVLLFYQPQYIYHLGFQLSFIISFSIILSQSILLLSSNKIVTLFLLSFICQLVASPLLMNSLNGFSLISPFVNLIFVPLYVFFILPICLFSFILLILVPGFFPIFGWIIDELINQTNHFAFLLNDIPFTTFPIGSLSSTSTTIFCTILFWCIVQFEKKRKLIISFFPLFLLFISLFFIHAYSPTGEVRFIDIGQGDSILIKRPFGKGTYLIDTGGKTEFNEEKWREKKHPYSVGKDTLIPFLKSEGIYHLNLLVLTHADFDHIGAATDLLKEIKVDQILITPGSEVRPEMKKIIKIATTKKIKLTYSKIGMSWGEKDETFKVISPEDETYEGNNDSIVISAKMGGLKWIFTGDLEKEGEDKLLKTYQQKIDVLKVGHHGSSSSTSDQWLNILKPRIAIISAGRNNLYHHPHPSVIKKLTDRGIQIYSTQEEGMISYLYRGQNGTFQVEIP